MDKIVLQPNINEILLKGSPKEGYFDVFSYNYDDEQKEKLGSLFVVGNVSNGIKESGDSGDESAKDPSRDINYVVNLVASLAKREYYGKLSALPKEAFSATLKKVNDVIAEFFEKKDSKINIGIFAIAGENIFISKLGKFKLVLARDNKTIDVLNNIDLFTKEVSQEKEFTNIVSGKIMAGDRILAFYPNRTITSREKGIKKALIKSSPTQFMDVINAIKTDKPEFACAAIHINLEKVTKPALPKKPQPPELGTKEIPAPIAPLSSAPEVNLAKSAIDAKIEPKINTEDFASKPLPEMPKIIPAEFSLGRKQTLFSKFIKKTRMINLNQKSKFIVWVIGFIILLGVGFAIKSVFFASPADRQLNTIITQVQSDLKTAKVKIGQNNLAEARKLLANSLASLDSISTSSKKSDQLKADLMSTLDGIDQATVATATSVETLPSDVAGINKIISDQKTKLRTGGYKFSSMVIDASLYQDNLYILSADGIYKIADISKNPTNVTRWIKSGLNLSTDSLLITVDGKIYVINKTGLLTTYYKGDRISEVNTSILPDLKSQLLTSSDGSNLYLLNENSNRIYIISKSSETLVKTLKLDSPIQIQSAVLDSKDELFITTSDGKNWRIQ